MGFNIRHINYNRHLIGVEYGGDYFSPDTVKAEMATVDNLITSLVRDVSDSKAPDSFRKSLADFVLSWRAFRDDNSGWLSRAMNINYAKTLEFKHPLTQKMLRVDSELPGDMQDLLNHA